MLKKTPSPKQKLFLAAVIGINLLTLIIISAFYYEANQEVTVTFTAENFTDPHGGTGVMLHWEMDSFPLLALSNHQEAIYIVSQSFTGDGGRKAASGLDASTTFYVDYYDRRGNYVQTVAFHNRASNQGSVGDPVITHMGLDALLLRFPYRLDGAYAKSGRVGIFLNFQVWPVDERITDIGIGYFHANRTAFSTPSIVNYNMEDTQAAPRRDMSYLLTEPLTPGFKFYGWELKHPVKIYDYPLKVPTH